jgi:hypothetical protein
MAANTAAMAPALAGVTPAAQTGTTTQPTGPAQPEFLPVKTIEFAGALPGDFAIRAGDGRLR